MAKQPMLLDYGRIRSYPKYKDDSEKQVRVYCGNRSIGFLKQSCRASSWHADHALCVSLSSDNITLSAASLKLAIKACESAYERAAWTIKEL